MAMRSKRKKTPLRKPKTKTRLQIQREYRSRLAKYNKYLERTSAKSPKSFKEWNAPYRETKFLTKEYKLYQILFESREESSTFGFRSDKEIEEYNFRDFKEQYWLKRNTLAKEVRMGEREKIGSVITEMVNDQAYELSSPKARAIAGYLLENERHLLEEKGLLRTKLDENGNVVDIVKRKKLELLIRQGRFIDEEVGLWDEIKLFYRNLLNAGYSASEAREEIGQTYFNSPE